jgi:hypothetical protein
VFVVWSSQLRGTAADVPEAAALMNDARATHYWDGAQRLGALYQTLELGEQKLRGDEPMWDVWLLFGPEARWEKDGAPPKPDWWEHQLRFLPEERRLDPARFARKAAELAPG